MLVSNLSVMSRDLLLMSCTFSCALSDHLRGAHLLRARHGPRGLRLRSDGNCEASSPAADHRSTGAAAHVPRAIVAAVRGWGLVKGRGLVIIQYRIFIDRVVTINFCLNCLYNY